MASKPQTPQAPNTPQPQQQYNPAMYAVSTTPLGPDSTRVTCPSCHASVSTTIKKQVTTKTHLFALILCIVGLCPCAIAVYVCDCCKSTQHFCPNCGAFLGAFD